MTADRYVPKVGDRVRHKNWTKGYVDVAFVGISGFFGPDEGGAEEAYSLCSDWVLVPKPTPWPELVINVYPDCATWGPSEAAADETANGRRIGKIYVHTDGTVTAVRTEATS